jgi:hypothetical protein
MAIYAYADETIFTINNKTNELTLDSGYPHDQPHLANKINQR